MPKSELDLFKPIEVHKEESEFQQLIRIPSPMKKMIVSMEVCEPPCNSVAGSFCPTALPVCEHQIKYFDTGMKKPKEERMMKDGKIHGIYKRWHPEGTICEESTYMNGKLHGKQYYYSIYGRLMQELNYNEGIMHGIQIAYHEKLGTIMSKYYYKEGKPYGEHTTYHKNGTLSSLCTYNDSGMLIGTARNWHSNGRLARDATYIDGKLHGMYFEYNESDLPIRALYFEHGTIRSIGL